MTIWESLRNPSLMVVYDEAATLTKGDSRWLFKGNSDRCLLDFCFNANDSVWATATAVAARMRICLFSSGAACAVRLQTSHEQEAYQKYHMHILWYAIPNHFSIVVELVIPACSSRLRIPFMFSELLVACSAWHPKKAAQSCWECLKQLATTPSLLISFAYLWTFVASTTLATFASSERTHPKGIVWKDLQKWFDIKSPDVFGLCRRLLFW